MNTTEMNALDVHLTNLKLDQTGQVDIAYYEQRGRYLQARALRRGFSAAARWVSREIRAGWQRVEPAYHRNLNLSQRRT